MLVKIHLRRSTRWTWHPTADHRASGEGLAISAAATAPAADMARVGQEEPGSGVTAVRAGDADLARDIEPYRARRAFAGLCGGAGRAGWRPCPPPPLF